MLDPSKPVELRLASARQLARSIQRFGPLVAADQEARLLSSFDQERQPAVRIALATILGALRPKPAQTGARLQHLNALPAAPAQPTPASRIGSSRRLRNPTRRCLPPPLPLLPPRKSPSRGCQAVTENPGQLNLELHPTRVTGISMTRSQSRLQRAEELTDSLNQTIERGEEGSGRPEEGEVLRLPEASAVPFGRTRGDGHPL